MAHDVFISYSHLDVETAERICDEIEAGDAKCWMAPRDIEEGEEWAGAITQALSAAKIFLLVFSSNSNLSDQVMREVNLAISKKLVIVPVKIEKFEPTGRMLYYLSPLHWIELSEKSFDTQIIRLKGRISRILESGGKDTGEEGPGNGNKGKKLLKFLIPAAVVVLVALSVFIFQDKLFQNATAGLNALKTEASHQVTESTNAPEPSTPQEASATVVNTPTPSPEPAQKKLKIAYAYDSEANSIKLHIFTEYKQGTVYVNRLPVEAEMVERIDGILAFNFDADVLNVYEPVTLSVMLKDSGKEDSIIALSNFFFCSGDFELSELVNFSNTECIYLAGDGIIGSIDAFSDMQMLKRLDILNCPNIEGNIQSLNSLTGLTGLGFLGSDNVKGDISTISGLTNLEYIDLQGDSFSGDLSVIGEFSGLEQMYLGMNSNIKGDISELNKLSHLNMIYIDSCSGIHGDIAGLNDLDSIERIFILGADGLEGDVASFSKLTSIERIYLGRCNNLHGNIGDLSDLHNRSIFAVNNCPNIEGTLKLPTGETVIANK